MPRLRLSDSSNNAKPLLVDRLKLYDQHEDKVQQALVLVRKGSTISAAERITGISSKTISMRLNCSRSSIRTALEGQKRKRKQQPSVISTSCKVSKKSSNRRRSSNTAARQVTNKFVSRQFLLDSDDPTKLHLTFDEEVKIGASLRELASKCGPFPYQLISETLRYYVRVRNQFQILKHERKVMLNLENKSIDEASHVNETAIETDSEYEGDDYDVYELKPHNKANNQTHSDSTTHSVETLQIDSPNSSKCSSPYTVINGLATPETIHHDKDADGSLPTPPRPSFSYLTGKVIAPMTPPDGHDLLDLESVESDRSSSSEPEETHDRSASVSSNKSQRSDSVSSVGSVDDMIPHKKPTTISIAPSFITNFCKRNGIQTKTVASIHKEQKRLLKEREVSPNMDQFASPSDINLAKSQIELFHPLRFQLVEFEFLQQQQQSRSNYDESTSHHLQPDQNDSFLEKVVKGEISKEMMQQMLSSLINSSRVLRLCYVDEEESHGNHVDLIKQSISTNQDDDDLLISSTGNEPRIKTRSDLLNLIISHLKTCSQNGSDKDNIFDDYPQRLIGIEKFSELDVIDAIFENFIQVLA